MYFELQLRYSDIFIRGDDIEI